MSSGAGLEGLGLGADVEGSAAAVAVPIRRCFRELARLPGLASP